ncbi:AraC family transcriptional regulator ligand-binding domain-containing protein [Streptomyces sp. NPDC004787]|uniref:AraC family transcriptional regulator ligand-binding domain-containing protein n=1 Tax=Streptomyces sp. NPDC004787 TaxID=3154291 RepID=UPI0033B426E8
MTLDRLSRTAKGPARHRPGLTRHDPPLRRHAGTTPAAFTRVNVAAAARLGVDRAQYAHLLGTRPEHLADDRCRIPASTNVRLWELMTLRAPWHEVALYMAEQSTLGSLGLWDYLVTQAPTPLEGLRDAARFLATVADTGTETLRIEEDGRHVTLRHDNAAELTDDVASAIRAYALGLLRQRINETTRRTVTPVKVVLTARAPRSHSSLQRLYGTQAIEFAGPVSSLTFRAADLTAPLSHAPGLSELLRRHAEQVLAESIPVRDWLDLFRTTLRTLPDTEVPTLRVLARRMSLSPRTLQRRLEEHRTTWSEELQALRREHTLRLLASPDLTLDVIARRAGYADPGGLRRAVQRWTGQPLAALRASDQDGRRPTGPPAVPCGS